MILNGNAYHCQSVQDSLNSNYEINISDWFPIKKNISDWVIHKKLLSMFTQTKKKLVRQIESQMKGG